MGRRAGPFRPGSRTFGHRGPAIATPAAPRGRCRHRHADPAGQYFDTARIRGHGDRDRCPQPLS
ncbi:hypothetical protein AZ78_2221 [Lysobacter capsici AZ78]|uniref:Uncharacterized protein n=1 Tax=Lysobacter capsici AZ78 TaxID=1444315 RepID=A0A120AGJ1_9GAMM|nr:hypothetical protein AZ78_2221 [Lysobacter capsici AZ78]